MPGMLPKIGLKLGENKTLVLSLPRKLADLSGERVEKRPGRVNAGQTRSSRADENCN